MNAARTAVSFARQAAEGTEAKVKKTRGGRMAAAKKRAAKKSGGKGRVAKRAAGKNIMKT
jgi:hypothetical protein